MSEKLYIQFQGKQTLLYDCPSWYLKWVAENWKEDTSRNKLICQEADKEWREREALGTHDQYE